MSMRMSFGQEMRMAQKQVLAPRMIQSMEILQLPLLALEERIEQEIQNNETLELVEPEIDNNAPVEPQAESLPTTTSEQPLLVDQEHANKDDFERSYDWSNEYPDTDEDRRRPSAGRSEETSDRYFDTIANMEDRPETLFNHLHDQLANYETSPEIQRAADKVIFNLDANGYLPMPLDELVDAPPTDSIGQPLIKDKEDFLKKQKSLLESGLRIVQSMDPPGVGARDLKECLLLQVSDDAAYAGHIRQLIQDHLENLAANRLPLIERKTGFTIEEIEKLRDLLHSLDPKPGAVFTMPFVPPVRPDVFAEQQTDSTWKVRLDDVDLPSLRISPTYRRILQSPDTDPQTREYIKRKINSAQWLIEAIEQRRGTLLKTAQAIVDHQTRFFSEGPEAIEPLKMQQIADRIGMHVTTVSRAVDDKWLQTPRGLFPLRKFFVGGTVSADGDEVAWDAVRKKLQEIVLEESKEKPFSDDELVEELAKQGITVARRTVTKYRKAMNIPSSRQRRDWKLSRQPRDNSSRSPVTE
jgi:RNA polymerase sigma-54 factor